MNALYIYKSSAGSGKTFTLVKNYLKLVLQNPSAYRHTLAITFTNKATAEMKGRIVSGLVKLAEDRAPDLKKVLESELNNPLIDIQQRALSVLQSILHDYSNFSVSTIDSFFSRILRSLAKEMQLPLKFEMEMNQDYITGKLTGMLLNDIGKSPILTEWLQQFVFEKMENEKGWNIESEIKHIALEVFKHRESDLSVEKKITLNFIATLKKIKFSFEQQMQLFGREFISIITNESLEVADFSNGKKGVANYFIKIQEGLKGSQWSPGSRVYSALESPDNWVSKTSNRRDQIISLAKNQLIPLLNKIIQYYNQQFKDYLSACEVLSVSYMAGLVNHLHGKMKQYRDEQNILMISDTNTLIKKFINNTDTPFVYEKTGNTYHNYLVDEFQDTADLQWNNLLPLVINGLGSGGMAMLVGDAKQSIYRWRGGNSRLLLEQINMDLKNFSSLKTTFHLDTNYRSCREIVDFNNTFFSGAPSLLPLSDPALMKLAYDEMNTVQQVSESRSREGFVAITLFKDKDINEDGENEKWHHAALEKMMDTISRLQEQGYNLQDIAILIRTNKDGKKVADHLYSNGITKISSADSIQLFQAPQVIFLINILTCLVWPENKPAQAEVAWYYQKYILKNKSVVNDDLFLSAGNSGQTKNNRYFPDAWNIRNENLVGLPIYELVEKLTDMFGLNLMPDAYIQRFQDMILEYSQKNKPSIREFLKWWKDHKESDKLTVVTPPNKDAINIVSIHKSKGLQFPIIILPFADWSLIPKSNELLWISSEQPPYDQLDIFPVKTNQILFETWFSESFQQETVHTYLDNLNLLYVAFTRAEEKLFIFSVNNPPEDKKITRVSQLLSQTINQQESWQDKIISENEIQIFETGNPSQKAIRKETINAETNFESPENISMESYPFSQWSDNLNIRTSRNPLADLDDDENISPIDAGIILHAAMALIKHPNDSEQAIRKITTEFMLTPDEADRLRNELDLVFKLTESENWFAGDWHVLNETEITNPEGNLIRPDRVLFKGKSAVVIDYKTGQAEAIHQKQVSDYANTLARMGFSDVKGSLLYLKDKKVVHVC